MNILLLSLNNNMIRNIMILLKNLNCQIYVLSNNKKSIIKYSIIPKQIFFIDIEASDPEILEKTLSIQKNHDIQRIVATDFDSTLFLARNAKTLDGLHAPTSPEGMLIKLHNKWRFYELCNDLGVLTPNTKKVEAKNLSREIQTLPSVLKPIEEGPQGRGNQKKVKIIKSKQELKEFEVNTTRTKLLAQDYISGKDRDISIFAVNGKILISTIQEKISHNRFRILKDERLEEIAQKIIEHTNFSGLAHFDLRISNEGIPYMIECNPRIWNSISVSIKAGFDYLGALLNNPAEAKEVYEVKYGLIKNRSETAQIFIDPFIAILVFRKFRKRILNLPRKIMSKLALSLL